MKYDVIVQPDPIRVSGIEAENDTDAEAKVRVMMDEQRNEFARALMASKWRMTLTRSSEIVLPEPSSAEEAHE